MMCLLASDEEMQLIEVEYVTLEGWCSDITGVRQFEHLPDNAKKYVEIIQSQLNIPGEFTFIYGC